MEDENLEIITYRQALHDGLYDILKMDPKAFLMGEDVGLYGGAYAVSKDMLKEFGPDRIKDTPLSESAFTGIGIGAAMGGMHPIVEIMTCNFALLALDQIINNAATLRHMSGGQISIPLVIKIATGAGRQLAAQHSHSWEGWFAHIPGIKVMTPATVSDARYMLQTAVKDPNPVLFFEQAALYNLEDQVNKHIPNDLFKANVLRHGTDITLISYGASVHKCLEASEKLIQQGINVQVLDLRSLRPLDTQSIIQSVSKTHRAIVVDEGWKSGSLSAEISAIICENCFYELDAPVGRVCSEEIPIPYAKELEEKCLPQPQKIINAVKECLDGGY